ncbi:MAG TPA: histidinol-phosphate transaminase [Terriglobia bacterium]|nr:histidinol-phosphate transaminase [Terriglobia bacterium]
MRQQSPLDVIKPEARKLSAYTLEHVQADVKLDQNESPYELPEDLKRAAVERVLARPWARYPEFIPTSITKALARFTGWPVEGILVGNGSNELIQSTLTVTLGPSRTVAIPQPTFTLYKLMSSILQANIVTVPLRAKDLSYDVEALAAAAAGADITVMCLPNNPTGSVVDAAGLKKIVESARGIVIVDEAYHEFHGESAFGLLADHPNLIVLRTFSKAMSMAALRFGYLMASPDLTREIYKAKLPYNVNVFTQAVAEMVIERRPMMDEPIRRIVAERERMMRELKARPGVECFESRANFILFRTGRPAKEVFDAIRMRGVLTRDVSGYPMLDRCLRVSVGLPNENDRFLEALDAALSVVAASR